MVIVIWILLDATDHTITLQKIDQAKLLIPPESKAGKVKVDITGGGGEEDKDVSSYQ